MPTSEPGAAGREAAAGGWPAADNVRNTDRLEAFSDGVIAIAITLLIIDIRPPNLGAGGGDGALLAALGAQWPAYLGFLVSFLTIGVMWINHHNLFRYIARTDPWLIAINTLFLLCVAAIPFPTALMADYLGQPGARVATAVYGGWFTLTALVYNLLWRYPASGRRLIDPEAPQAAIDAITRRFRFGPPVYLLATLLALVNPDLSVAVQLLLAAFFFVPYRSRA